MNSKVLLEVKNLRTAFHTDDGEVVAVDDVSFQIEAGKTLGIVGESGCGKSVTSLSIMRLIPEPPGKILSGQILFEGKDLLQLSESEMRGVRGNKISMIFQEPMTSLNPVFTIGDQIGEAIGLHQKGLSRQQIVEKCVEMLKRVGIPEPENRVHSFPHQLSGGMRQRAMIAMSLSCNPQILIADEPTTALDVTIQAQILDLMKNIRLQMGTAMILITHDLGVVAETCDHVAVMYAGKIIEMGSVRDIFSDPKHWYTKGLLNSIPHFESGHRLKRLETIPGIVPNLIDLKAGCRFQERCKNAQPKCREKQPNLSSVNSSRSSSSHQVACYFPVNSGVNS